MEYLFNNLAAFQRGNELKAYSVPSKFHPLMIEIKSTNQTGIFSYQLTMDEIIQLRDLLNSLIAV